MIERKCQIGSRLIDYQEAICQLTVRH